MPSPQRANLDAISSAGVILPPSRVAPKGVTLANATTYYIPFPVEVASQRSGSMYMSWAAAMTGTVTLEATNHDDVTDFSTTAGEWVQVNPSTASVPVSGASNTSTAATVTMGGAAAGSALFELPDMAARRWRLKVVTTVGGLARFSANAKYQG